MGSVQFNPYSGFKACMFGVVVAIILLMCSFQAQSQDFQSAGLDSLARLSNQQNKPLLIYLQTDWCRWCKLMERETFTDSAVWLMMNESFICGRFNAEKDEDGLRLRTKYAISQYPTVIILDPKGNLIYTIEGFSPSVVFAEELKRAKG